MKTVTIEKQTFDEPRQWKQINHNPKRFDDVIDKIVPFMVSEPSNYIEKFKETFGEESDEWNSYYTYTTLADSGDKEYFRRRLKEKYEQYLYCFFPEMYDEYEFEKSKKETKDLMNSALYSQNKKYNESKHFVFLG